MKKFPALEEEATVVARAERVLTRAQRVVRLLQADLSHSESQLTHKIVNLLISNSKQ